LTEERKAAYIEELKKWRLNLNRLFKDQLHKRAEELYHIEIEERVLINY